VNSGYYFGYLRTLQDETLEHQWPRKNGNVSYFIEASGDIYRELCQTYVSSKYVSEKLSKLEKFYELTEGDFKELREHQTPEYVDELMSFLDRIGTLKLKTIEVVAPEEGIERKELMGEVCEVMASIVRWGANRETYTDTSLHIDRFVRKVRSSFFMHYAPTGRSRTEATATFVAGEIPPELTPAEVIKAKKQKALAEIPIEERQRIEAERKHRELKRRESEEREKRHKAIVEGKKKPAEYLDSYIGQTNLNKFVKLVIFVGAGVFTLNFLDRFR